MNEKELKEFLFINTWRSITTWAKRTRPVRTDRVVFCIEQPREWEVPPGQENEVYEEICENVLRMENANVEIEMTGPNRHGVWAIAFRGSTLCDNALKIIIVNAFTRYLCECGL